jgi:hypothetical protein
MFLFNYTKTIGEQRRRTMSPESSIDRLAYNEGMQNVLANMVVLSGTKENGGHNE